MQNAKRAQSILNLVNLLLLGSSGISDTRVKSSLEVDFTSSSLKTGFEEFEEMRSILLISEELFAGPKSGEFWFELCLAWAGFFFDVWAKISSINNCQNEKSLSKWKRNK